MEQISIIFSKASTKFAVFSWAIMAVEKTPYSHVAIKMIDDETGQTVIYQASHTMVNEMSEEVFLAQEEIIDQFNFSVSPAVKKAVKTFAIANLGKPYGVLSIVGLAYVQALKLVNVNIHNPFKEVGQTYVCSQFVAAILKNCTNVMLDMPIDDITPKDLYPMVQKLPIALI